MVASGYEVDEPGRREDTRKTNHLIKKSRHAARLSVTTMEYRSLMCTAALALPIGRPNAAVHLRRTERPKGVRPASGATASSAARKRSLMPRALKAATSSGASLKRSF